MKNVSSPGVTPAWRERLPLLGIGLVLLVVVIVAAWMQSGGRQAGTTAAIPHEMPAVSPEEQPQTAETPASTPDPTLSEHDRAVRREVLENMRQSAASH